jgi:hypothetical protein
MKMVIDATPQGLRLFKPEVGRECGLRLFQPAVVA